MQPADQRPVFQSDHFSIVDRCSLFERHIRSVFKRHRQATDFIAEAIDRNGATPHTVHADSAYGWCQVFPGFVTLTPIDPRGYRGVGGVLAAS